MAKNNFNPLTVTVLYNRFFLVTGEGVILPPIVFRLYCPYLKISNGATHVIIGAKFITHSHGSARVL